MHLHGSYIGSCFNAECPSWQNPPNHVGIGTTNALFPNQMFNIESTTRHFAGIWVSIVLLIQYKNLGYNRQHPCTIGHGWLWLMKKNKGRMKWSDRMPAVASHPAEVCYTNRHIADSKTGPARIEDDYHYSLKIAFVVSQSIHKMQKNVNKKTILLKVCNWPNMATHVRLRALSSRIKPIQVSMESWALGCPR